MKSGGGKWALTGIADGTQLGSPARLATKRRLMESSLTKCNMDGYANLQHRLQEAQIREERLQRRAEESERRAEELLRRAEESQRITEDSERRSEDSERRAEESQRRAEESQRRSEDLERRADDTSLRQLKFGGNHVGLKKHILGSFASRQFDQTPLSFHMQHIYRSWLTRLPG